MNFAIIGVAGFIAFRHLEAIRDLGHKVMAGVDIHDSAGRLDWFDLGTRFYPSMAYLVDLPLDYISICTPNHLHAQQIELALSMGYNVITEKPTVTEPGCLPRLQELEARYSRQVSTISQLRLHPEVIELRQSLDPGRRYTVQMDYCAPRGEWYQYSWQSNPRYSGGLPMSIGFHMFDLLLYLFGPVDEGAGGPGQGFEVARPDNLRCGGKLTLERADVEWKLTTLPRENNGRTLTIDGISVDLSSSFTALHTEAYRQILAGDGLTIQDVRPTIELCYNLANY